MATQLARPTPSLDLGNAAPAAPSDVRRAPKSASKVAPAAAPAVEFSLAKLPPNWFASVMGTGIVANAAASLPLQFPGLRTAATVVWALAAAWLVVLGASWIVHCVKHFDVARTYYRDPVLGHFYGAPPMALMTVGAGTLLLGRDWIGESAAVAIHSVLWTCGTLLGLFVAVFIPYTQFVRQQLSVKQAFGGWLMPVVPPMVSAATGALLIPYAPEGAGRTALLAVCYGLFGFTLLASAIVIPLIVTRLVRYGRGTAGAVPTYWIVLGPLGQSITAANLLSVAAVGVVSPELSGALATFGLVYGFTALTLALAWMAVAATLVIRTALTRRTGGPGLPFSLTWWSFTFPLGTCVTGVSGLWAHTGNAGLGVLAIALYVGLVGAWAVVAYRTMRAAA